MKITYTSALNLLTIHTVQADDDMIIVGNKNILGEWHTEYDYSELSDRVVAGKRADNGWSNLGWWMLFLTVIPSFLAIFAFQSWKGSVVLLDWSVATFGLAIIFFLLYFFVKREYVNFYQKDSQYGFSIIMTKENNKEAKRLVDFIKAKIKKTKSGQSQKKSSNK